MGPVCVWGGGREMPVDTAWFCSLEPLTLVAASAYPSMFRKESVMAWDQTIVVVTMSLQGPEAVTGPGQVLVVGRRSELTC